MRPVNQPPLSLMAMKDNPDRLRAIGHAVWAYRLWSFAVGGMITGLAGALYADLNRFVSPSMLSWQMSGEIMVFVILGGVGRLYGPVAGGALFITLEHVLGGISPFWHVWLGFLLLLVVLFARGGVIGLLAGRRVAHD